MVSLPIGDHREALRNDPDRSEAPLRMTSTLAGHRSEGSAPLQNLTIPAYESNLPMKENSVVSSGLASSRILRSCLGTYLFQITRIWNHLPASVRRLPLGQAYGRHLHAVVRLYAERKQYFATFFLRNRAELELMRRLLGQRAPGSSLDVSVLACSKGAEVYSILWALRSARPDLRLTTHAVDISQEILEFAERGIYSCNSSDVSQATKREGILASGDVNWNTCRDQSASIFERMTEEEMQEIFEMKGDQAKVRSWLKEKVIWLRGDAGDPELVGVLGPQDIVVANRFLCHMRPADAEACLRNIGRMVKPGGYLFVSGIDVSVRTKVARQMGWEPVEELLTEIHEGDVSLRLGWPLEYWGLEPFHGDRSDWRLRYASVFRIGKAA
jgi:chemotaxis methyl-accepting protein methylase